MDIETTRMPLTSQDVVQDRLDRLREVFPEVFAEGKIDFDKLRQMLGDNIDTGRERYGLTWAGKADAIRAIQSPSIGMLRPCPDESVNFDTTENLLIEGDNLEVLKLLQKSYYGRVKMIYIDPPYNTGNEFIYPDNYREGLEDYLKYSGQVNDEGVRQSTNTETSGRYHSKWLTMMYPRLFLARNLLVPDGFLVASIDDVELSNLRLLLDEVFGPENFVAVLVWDRNRKNDAKYFSVGHEYMVVYAKDVQFLRDKNVILRAPKEGVEELREQFVQLRKETNDDWGKIQATLREFFDGLAEDDPRKPLARFTKVDQQGPYRDDGNINWPGGGGPDYDVPHPVTGKSCKKPRSGWRYPTKERFDEEVAKGRIVFGPDETTVPRVRTNLFENSMQVLQSVHYSYAQTASNEFDAIFDGIRVFDNPKPFGDLALLVNYLTDENDVVLDFFAGSCSTAHGVIECNSKHGTKRRFICVQLPEPVAENTTTGRNALSLGLHNIFQIGVERIRRVVAQCRANAAGKLTSMSGVECADLGFRVLRLTSSNFKIWSGEEAPKDAEALGHQLKLFADHIDHDRPEQDILYELMLKAGLPLTVKIDTKNVAGQSVYSIADGMLLICLANPITQDCLRGMTALQPQRVVCLDAAFKGNDQLKTNTVLEMKSHGIEFRTV